MMKKIFTTLILVLLALVLILKVSDMFIRYDEEMSDLLNILMFSLIGVAYIGYSFDQTKRIYQIIYILCGAFLIVMNFIDRNTLLTFIGIACIVIPMIIGKLSKSNSEEASD